MVAAACYILRTNRVNILLYGRKKGAAQEKTLEGHNKPITHSLSDPLIRSISISEWSERTNTEDLRNNLE